MIEFSHPRHRGDQRRRQDRRPRGGPGRRGRFSDAQTSPSHAPGAAARRCERWRSTRRGAQTARTAAINELKALIISAPVDPCDQLRGLTTAAQVAKCAAFRLPAAPLDELTATKQALRSLAPRIKTPTAEAADPQTSIRGLVEAVAPHLLDQPGGYPPESWRHRL